MWRLPHHHCLVLRSRDLPVRLDTPLYRADYLLARSRLTDPPAHLCTQCQHQRLTFRYWLFSHLALSLDSLLSPPLFVALPHPEPRSVSLCFNSDLYCLTAPPTSRPAPSRGSTHSTARRSELYVRT